MSGKDSTKTIRRASTGQPGNGRAKPKVRKDFPLTWHPAGQWCKRVLGRLHYFGADPDRALQRWCDDKDDLLAGRKPRQRKRGSSTLEEAVNLFLDHVEDQVERGEKSRRWYEDMCSTGKLLLAALGRSWAVESLTPEDFESLRKRLSLTRKRKGEKQRQVSHTTLNNRVTRVRTMFNWLLKAKIITAAPDYAAAFDAPDMVARENERLERGTKDFTRAEVRSLLRHAKDHPRLYAAILLALNTGCQNADITTLKRSHVDLAGGWYLQPRAKRAKRRRAKLWPRTVRALQAVIGNRQLADDDLIFTSATGGPWHGRNCLAKEFATLKSNAGITKARCGFQWLRHTFITQASQGGDLIAVQLAVGHVDRTITARYIHSVYDPRLESIANLVDSWLTGKGGGR
ncbi:MAG: tyrosine-type recombinase/integrase [Pirellulaceae bacterium]|nr:tyrosine-type recombinase/integrase [Pirellulaceae bacterium]